MGRWEREAHALWGGGGLGRVSSVRWLWVHKFLSIWLWKFDCVLRIDFVLFFVCFDLKCIICGWSYRYCLVIGCELWMAKGITLGVLTNVCDTRSNSPKHTHVTIIYIIRGTHLCWAQLIAHCGTRLCQVVVVLIGRWLIATPAEELRTLWLWLLMLSGLGLGFGVTAKKS